MDLGFSRRSRSGPADRESAHLDYGMLTAALQALQSTSITARLQAKVPDPVTEASEINAALVELLTAGPSWREAVERQGGSFNAAYARKGESD